MPVQNCCRNIIGQKYIQDALQSILQQSIPVEEILIIDNQSTDDTADFILELQKSIPTISLLKGKGNRKHQDSMTAHHTEREKQDFKKALRKSIVRRQKLGQKNKQLPE